MTHKSNPYRKAPVPLVSSTFEPKFAQLLDVLAHNGGNITSASRECGCTAATSNSRFIRAIELYGVDRICKTYPVLTKKVTERAQKMDYHELPQLAPDDLIEQARQMHALPKRMLDRLQERVDNRIPDPDTVITTEAELLTAIQTKMALALGYMDRYQLAGSTLSELTSAVKALFDMQQILQGKPTQINASKNMSAIKDLLVPLLKEAKRRGHTISMGGHEAHPPGGSSGGPIPPLKPPDFSKNGSEIPQMGLKEATTLVSTPEGYIPKVD